MKALYLRQSLNTTGEEVAVNRQRTECLRWSGLHQWEIEREYVDNDRSATTGDRPEYQRPLADIEAGTVTGVLAWDLDRLHRQPVELEHFIALADSRYLQLATVAGETDLSTDQGRLVARLKGAVARAEIERKSARHKAANRALAASGDLQPKVRPFGWVKTHEGNKINFNTLDADESAAIATAVEDILSGKRSMGSIIKQWNTQGLLTTQGKLWTNDSMRKMLLRPRNAGLQLYNGEIIGTASCEPIITVEQRNLLEGVFKHRQKQNHPTGRVHPFSGPHLW